MGPHRRALLAHYEVLRSSGKCQYNSLPKLNSNDKFKQEYYQLGCASLGNVITNIVHSETVVSYGLGGANLSSSAASAVSSSAC